MRGERYENISLFFLYSKQQKMHIPLLIYVLVYTMSFLHGIIIKITYKDVSFSTTPFKGSGSIYLSMYIISLIYLIRII